MVRPCSCRSADHADFEHPCLDGRAAHRRVRPVARAEPLRDDAFEPDLQIVIGRVGGPPPRLS
jgi:hypothetical protein